MSLHLTWIPTPEIVARLSRWDAVARSGIEAVAGGWRAMVVWDAARDASVSGSTGLEGNPLTPEQVDAVLSGGEVADGLATVHVREVLNYKRALDLARTAVARPGFEWTHEVIHQVNAAVTSGLPVDTRGRYREGDQEVYVGIFRGPSPLAVQGLMGELVDWLRASRGDSSLARSALLHLNLIAIHPFMDGNGRTSRILAAMALMEAGVPFTELISTESYLRRHRDEYVAMLRTSLGYGYDPDNHPATEWLDYYTRISLDRLDVRDRIMAALPGDIGIIHAVLADAGDPPEWAPILLAAIISRLRTERVAAMTSRSAPRARALLAEIVSRGWLEPRGQTRGRSHVATRRLAALALRVPVLMRHLAAGEQLAMFEADGRIRR